MTQATELSTPTANTNNFITSLPNELLFHIFNYLDREEHVKTSPGSGTPLKHLSYVSHQFRQLAVQLLFRTFRCTYSSTNRPLGHAIFSALTLPRISQQPLVIANAKYLDLRLLNRGDVSILEVAKQYKGLLSIIRDLPHLDAISLDVGDHPTPWLRDTITSMHAELKLDRIKTLALTCRAAFFLAHCPNVSSLVMKCTAMGSNTCIYRTSSSSQIKRLTVFGRSAVSHIRGIAAAYPNVRHLVVRNRDLAAETVEVLSFETDSRSAFAPHFSELETIEVNNTYTHGHRATRRATVAREVEGTRYEKWSRWFWCR